MQKKNVEGGGNPGGHEGHLSCTRSEAFDSGILALSVCRLHHVRTRSTICYKQHHIRFNVYIITNSHAPKYDGWPGWNETYIFFGFEAVNQSRDREPRAELTDDENEKNDRKSRRNRRRLDHKRNGSSVSPVVHVPLFSLLESTTAENAVPKTGSSDLQSCFSSLQIASENALDHNDEEPSVNVFGYDNHRNGVKTPVEQL